MCGIIGIIGEENVSHKLYSGLFQIQHRGQDSAGIFTTEGTHPYIKKGVGLVADIFSSGDLESLVGDIGIGQNRYYTSEGGVAQPFYESVGGCVFGHNGQVVNHLDLRDYLRSKRYYSNSTCDAEILNHLLMDSILGDTKENKITDNDIFKGVGKFMDNAQGSYSAIFILLDKGMGVFRDLYANRPFKVGKKDSAYAFTSETPALDILKYEHIGEVKPGELWWFDFDNKPYTPFRKRIRESGIEARCFFERHYLQRPSDREIINGKLVEAKQIRRRIGEILAKRDIEDGFTEFDVVSGIPQSGLLYAKGYHHGFKEEGFDIFKTRKYRQVFDKNAYSKRSFIMPTQNDREHEVSIKFVPIHSEVKGKSLVITDDSIVRSPTSKRVISTLRNAGAEEIHIRVGSPPIISACHLGIDMPLNEELIAARLDSNVEKIRKYIGADTLKYVSIEDMVEVHNRINGSEVSLCLGCVSGKYPVPSNKRYIEARREHRKKPKSKE